MRIAVLQISIIAAFFVLLKPCLARGKLTGSQEGEFRGSYMEDQVMTYFNPDNDYDGAFLEAEAQKVAAYVVEKSRDLNKVIKQLSVSVMNSSDRYRGERVTEYRRRLNPFLKALNSELNKKNNEISGARLRAALWVASGGALIAGTIAFFWFGKEKKRLLKRQLNKAACYGLVGCFCGGALGMLGASLIGPEHHDVVDERRLLLSQSSEEKNENSPISKGPD